MIYFIIYFALFATPRPSPFRERNLNFHLLMRWHAPKDFPRLFDPLARCIRPAVDPLNFCLMLSLAHNFHRRPKMNNTILCAVHAPHKQWPRLNLVLLQQYFHFCTFNITKLLYDYDPESIASLRCFMGNCFYTLQSPFACSVDIRWFICLSVGARVSATDYRSYRIGSTQRK